MICPTDHLLHRFQDDELSPLDRQTVAEHLRACDACATKLQHMSQLSDLLRSAPLPLPAMSAILKWQRNTRLLQDRSIRRLASWMTAAASILLVASLYVSTSTQAQAMPTLHDWEAAVIGIDIEPGATDQATAQWMLTDLTHAPARSQP